MRLIGLMKAATALGLMISSASAVAASWSVDVKDDLFSETGKSAMLMSPGRQAALLFECEAGKIEFAFLSNEPQSTDERSGFSIPTLLVIKVDEEEVLRFSSAWSRRNQYYVHAEVVGSQYSNETLTLLKQIKAATSKVVVGTSTGDNNYSTTLPVSGSTAATTKFMDVCGIKE